MSSMYQLRLKNLDLIGKRTKRGQDKQLSQQVRSKIKRLWSLR